MPARVRRRPRKGPPAEDPPRFGSWGRRSWSVELHVLEIDRLAVDPLMGRRDPVRELAPLVHLHHAGGHVVVVGLAGEPSGQLAVELLLGNGVASDIERLTAVEPDLTVEAQARHL